MLWARGQRVARCVLRVCSMLTRCSEREATQVLLKPHVPCERTLYEWAPGLMLQGTIILLIIHINMIYVNMNQY